MISELVEMLGYCRPASSATEEAFIERFLTPMDMYRDDHGNLMKLVGNDPTIMWSSHTDTVHRAEGRVPILIDGNTARVHPGSKASCLGADCTTGVWIMMQMIRAKVPGLYVFHRGEEIGCHGSGFISKETPEILSGVQACIAFDRYGTDSVITHQMGERGCSTAFAKAMIAQLPGFQEDDGGAFTDSYTYFRQISECTNISVGYRNQHGAKEEQNLSFAAQLAEWMCKFDQSQLVFERDPSVEDYGFNFGFGPPRLSYKSPVYDAPTTRSTTVERLVRDHPAEIADLLEMYGIGVPEILSHLDYERVWN
jgi:hypothetical protein